MIRIADVGIERRLRSDASKALAVAEDRLVGEEDKNDGQNNATIKRRERKKKGGGTGLHGRGKCFNNFANEPSP